jgi:hypothetical protein
MVIQNLNRLIGMRDTKANIEAFTGTLAEVAFAYSTDTNELGIYVNGSWEWSAAGGKYRQFVYIVTAGDFDFVIDHDGNPVMALQELE